MSLSATLSSRSGLTRRPALLFSVGVSFWLAGILVQHASLMQELQTGNDFRQHHQKGPSPTSTLLHARSSLEQHHQQQKQHIIYKGDNGETPLILRSESELSHVAQQDKKQQPSNRSVANDATFNDLPLTFHRGTPGSSWNCLVPPFEEQGSGKDGENVDDKDDSWMFRSCQFQNICFDTRQGDYVLFISSSPHRLIVENHFRNTKNFSSLFAVALGGINPRWDMKSGFDKGSWKVKWFPRVVVATQNQEEMGFYLLPNDHVLIPFHSLGGHNVGHLVWDDFYPMISLMHMFDLLDVNNKSKMLPIRQVILPHKLYASCDIRSKKAQQCANNFAKFMPLLGVDPNHFSTSTTFRFETGQTPNPSPYVCASTAVAGLGMLTDHGRRDHGWHDFFSTKRPSRGLAPHNLGRGANFFAFSQFIVDSLLGGTATASIIQTPPPIVVTFSILSSRDEARRLDFAAQIAYLRDSLVPTQLFRIQAVKLWELDLKQQVRLAQQTHVFITAAGGGSMTATFLPRGATLIVYYETMGSVDYVTLQSTTLPARLDWDLLTNAGHLRVHWLPIYPNAGRNVDELALDLLLQLIRHEAQIILDGYTHLET